MTILSVNVSFFPFTVLVIDDALFVFALTFLKPSELAFLLGNCFRDSLHIFSHLLCKFRPKGDNVPKTNRANAGGNTSIDYSFLGLKKEVVFKENLRGHQTWTQATTVSAAEVSAMVESPPSILLKKAHHVFSCDSCDSIAVGFRQFNEAAHAVSLSYFKKNVLL
ncbi:hypothetical protein V6N13_148932 [Hibiscus sabdariffa]